MTAKPSSTAHGGSASDTKGRLTTVRFTTDDWPLVRFAEAPAALMETVLGVAELARRPSGIGGRRWVDRARRAFPPAARPLLDLISATGPWPAFLDSAAPDLDEALETVVATPKAMLKSELALTSRRAAESPPWVKALADGDPDAMRLLVRALRAFHVACVAPQWPEITCAFRGDLTERMAVLGQSGLGPVFGTLHGELALRDGALERTSGSIGTPGELRLDGHGLLVIPSVLWTGPPLFAICSPGLGGSAMIYATGTAPTRVQVLREAQPLAALMGRGRAAVLEALREPCGTAELAARVGIGAASASEHAAVLRAADLILTIRCGRGVRHSLTPLGRSLLNGTKAGVGRSSLAEAAELPGAASAR